MMATVVLISLCVLLTMSRGALVAIGVLLLVFLLRLRSRARVLVPILCSMVLVCLLPESFFARLNESVIGRAEGRFDIWIVGIQIISHHGIVGAGFDNFPVVYNQYAAFAPVFRGFSRAPHNIYLEVWAELGIVGVVLFVGAVISQLKESAAQVRESRTYALIALESACCALLARGLVANLLWRKAFWISWILLALVLQLAKRLPSSSQTVWFRQLEPGRAVTRSIRNTLRPARSFEHI